MTENEECFTPPSPEAVPRLMVIDGCNIARSSCGAGRENVNCAGLMAAIRWLVVRGFDVVAFLPVIYNNNYNFNATHVHLLPKLEELGVVTFTPARTARGDRRAFINYDDLYVAGLAERHGGCVLSGDRFKDILHQPQYVSLHPVLRDRRLDIRFKKMTHEFVQCGNDRFYKCFPEMCLKVSSEARPSVMAMKMFALPDDADFNKVVTRREECWSRAKSAQLVAEIDNLMDELCERVGTRPVVLPEPPIVHRRESHRQATHPHHTGEHTERYDPQENAETIQPSEATVARTSPTTTATAPWSNLDLLSMSVQELNECLNGGRTNTMPNIDVADEEIEEQYVWTSETDTTSSSTGDQPPISPADLPEIPVDFSSFSSTIERRIIDVDPSVVDDEIFATLCAAFPDEIVRKVLKDNVSRNLSVLGDLCAELV